MLVAPGLAHAAILSENFDELAPGGLNLTTAGAFTAQFGNVDAVGEEYLNGICAAPEANICIDLDGNTQGGLITDLGTLTPGTYYLSFDLIGSDGLGGYSGRDITTTTAVTLGVSSCSAVSSSTCVYAVPFTLAGIDTTDGIVTNAVITITTTGTYYLAFASETPGTNGALLDNVSFSSTVPEPSTFVLLGSALLGIGGLRRLRAKRNSR